MKSYKFLVHFEDNDFVNVTTNSPHQAAILAMAERIKGAKHSNIKYVKDEKDHKWIVSSELELKNIG